MVRGIERTTIFRDDTDRADFLARLASLAESGALTVYAWALLPNHAHLLGTVPRAWQATGNILAQFGATAPRARRAYRAFVRAGSAQGRRRALLPASRRGARGPDGGRAAIAQARAGIAYVWVDCLGQSGRALALWLGLHPAVVYKAARRGARPRQSGNISLRRRLSRHRLHRPLS